LDFVSSNTPINRHERRRRETADRIVEAAGSLFAERGFVATTVTDICERADVARQTFFNHFATKQDLVRELSVLGRAFALEALETARREESGTGARIGRFFALIHEAASGSGPMHQDLVAEVTRVTIDAADEVVIASLNRGMQKLLRAGRLQGDVSRRHALEDQAALVMGALQNLFFEWTHREDFPIAQRSARMARLLADALAPAPDEA
jgi:AcrR family transcriptional regulator